MTTGSWVQIVCLVLLILFSAFFSASETAFTSLNKIRLKTMADDGNKKAAKAYKMAENYDKLLSTVLVGNNIVNITASSVATVLFIRLINESKGPTVSTIIMTVLLLIFGEVTPKTLAKEMPEKYAMFATPFLRATHGHFDPRRGVLHALEKASEQDLQIQVLSMGPKRPVLSSAIQLNQVKYDNPADFVYMQF